MNEDKPKYRTQIWLEEASENDPFTADACYCHGYDVFNDLLGKATWCEYIYLLFTGERASTNQAKLLEIISIAIAHPGMRDSSVRAAMNAGVGGSTSAACLISALGVGAGQLGGAREVYTLVKKWYELGLDIQAWERFINKPNDEYERIDIWDKYEHPPGFDPNGVEFSLPRQKLLNACEATSKSEAIKWLIENRRTLESYARIPLSITLIVATAFYSLKLTPKQSEMLYLLLRLPGAAVHAIEQEEYGWKHFPFFGKQTELTDDPGSKGLPEVKDI